MLRLATLFLLIALLLAFPGVGGAGWPTRAAAQVLVILLLVFAGLSYLRGTYHLTRQH